MAEEKKKEGKNEACEAVRSERTRKKSSKKRGEGETTKAQSGRKGHR